MIYKEISKIKFKKTPLQKKIIRKKIKQKTISKKRNLKIKKIKNKRKPITYIFYYGDLEVKGAYEYRTCEILDDMIKNGSLTSWEYEKISIPYLGPDMKRHNYIVDFFLDINGKKQLLEVKGRETKLDRIKWSAARRYGWDLRIWKKDDIFVDVDYKQYLKILKETKLNKA